MANVGEHLHVRDERKGACERGRKGAEKSENQYDCQAAERSHEPWTNGRGQFGPQFLAMWIDILLPTLPLSPPVWKVER